MAGLEKRTGPPVEELAVERTVLRPGKIELTVRNDGPDAVQVSQVTVNDSFADFTASDPDSKVERLRSERVEINYPWVEGRGIFDLARDLYRARSTTRSRSRSRHPTPTSASTH